MTICFLKFIYEYKEGEEIFFFWLFSQWEFNMLVFLVAIGNSA